MLSYNSSFNVLSNEVDTLKEEMANGQQLGLLVKSKSLIRCSRLGKFTPAAFALFVFISLLWLVFEVPYILPARPEPPPFLWHSRLSRNVTSYIRPGKETALLNPREKCSSSVKVLFVVPSSVNNTYQRIAIRKTWGLWINNETKYHSSNLKSSVEKGVMEEMKLVFILGKDKMWTGKEISIEILKEHKLYGDIIVEDFIDSYINLTLKSIFMLKWVNMKCPQVKYIMKADDDMFINVPNLKAALNDPKIHSPLLMGTLICNAQPIKNRWSKWYSPPYLFTGKYPNYLSGTAYVVSGDLVKKLLNTAIQTPFFHLEDIYITGICAKKLGVRPVNYKGFSYLKRSFNPCIYKDVITSHEVKPMQMKKVWNMIHNLAILAKCKPIPKSVLDPQIPRKCVWR